VIAEVGWCGCCTDLVCQNGQLVVDLLSDWQPVKLGENKARGVIRLVTIAYVSDPGYWL